MCKIKYVKIVAMFLSIVLTLEFLAPSIRTFASDNSMDSVSNADITSISHEEAKKRLK